MILPTSRAKTIAVGDRHVGPGQPCYLIAEIGINHNGDMGLACEQIAAAAEAGADAVKFQNYKTEDFISDDTLTLTYKSQGETVTEPQMTLFKRCELAAKDLELLKSKCDEMKVEFCSTPTNQQGIDELISVGCRLLKNGSDFLGNLDVVRAMGETGLPTIISTGMATATDIDEAVRAFRETGNDQIVVLHCVSSYPTPPEQANLSRMITIGQAFDCVTGFSDHTEGALAAALCAAMGGSVIEKHFTLDRNLPGPDHWFSSTPDEFNSLVKMVRDAEKLTGSPALQLSDAEKVNREDFRLSCVSSRDMKKGERLTPADIVFRRPGNGIRPAESYLLDSRTLARDVSKGHCFQIEDFE